MITRFSKDFQLFLKMLEEISAAVSFILKLIKQNSFINEELLQKFEKCLIEQLYAKFTNHWHLENPCLGQGYRCLRLNGNNVMEPTIGKAALDSGVSYNELKLPLELTLWVDPNEVCCRFGEHKGSYCTIASFSNGKKKDFINEINISELISSDEETYSEECLHQELLSTSTQRQSISSVENMVPSTKSVSVSPTVLSVNDQNILRTAISPTHVCRASGRLLNASSPPFLYSQESFHHRNMNGILYSQNEVHPYFKQASWGVGSQSPVSSQPTICHSSAYISYSPPTLHISNHENFNQNRMSPPTLHANRLRWNSGPYVDVNGNHYLSEKHGWYYPRQLTRV